MKRLLSVLLFSIIIFNLNFSSAAICSDPSQVIFRISNSTNAHGEVYNGAGNYPEEICYDDIFGTSYQGQDPNSCTGSNLVLRLSANTNAHAEGPAEGNYVIDVCYGDLSCAIRTECNPGENVVVALSGNTNAHLEGATVGNYNNFICCSSPSGGESHLECQNNQCVVVQGPGENQCSSDIECQEGEGNIGKVEWQNGIGEMVFESYVNNTLYLYAETDAGEGSQIMFEIFEDDFFTDDSIRSGSDALYATVSGGKAVAQWKITDDDMAKTFDHGEFYFIASSGDSSNESLRISINTFEDKNTPPRANITAPKHKGIYFINEPVEFKEDSFDIDGSIERYYWTIEDQSGLVYESEEKTFIYSFVSADQYIITLRVEDDKGASGEHQIGLIGSGSPGMLAFINNPFHKQIVVNDTLMIRFDATDSYVINSTGNCPNVEIECLAGNCPIKTENYPSACGDFVTLKGNLNKGFAELNFSWEFDDSQKFSAFGLVSGNKAYPSSSDVFNDKKINLLLGYSNSGINLNKLTERVFTLLDVRQCIDGGQTFVFLDENGFELERRSTLDSSACAGPDGNVDTSHDNCCPTGFTCTEQGCRNDGSSPQQCSDYPTEDACDDDDFNVAEIDPLWNELNCGKTIDNQVITCDCAWNETAGSSGQCGLEKTSRGGGGGNDVCTEYQCLYTYEEQECINGYMNVNIEAFFTPGNCDPLRQDEYRAQCQAGAGERVIACGRPTIELSFFTNMQIISSLIVIALAYMIINYLRKKES